MVAIDHEYTYNSVICPYCGHDNGDVVEGSFVQSNNIPPGQAICKDCHEEYEYEIRWTAAAYSTCKIAEPIVHFPREKYKCCDMPDVKRLRRPLDYVRQKARCYNCSQRYILIMDD